MSATNAPFKPGVMPILSAYTFRDRVSRIFSLLPGWYLLIAHALSVSVACFSEALAQPAPLALEEAFRIGDAEEGPIFGHISDIAVNAAGQIFVSDWQNPVVHVFSDTGRLVTTIGTQGRGPGEFEMTSSIAVGQDERIYVWDGQLGRLSGFAERTDGEFGFDTSIRVERHNGQYPSAILGAGPQGLVFSYSTSYGFCAECKNEEPHFKNVFLVGVDGLPVGDPLLTLPATESLVVLGEGTIRVRSRPFGKNSIVTMSTSGKLYAGWPDAIRIEAQSLQHDWHHTFRWDHKPLPIHRRELYQATADFGRDDLEALQESGIPDSKPAFRNFVVDDEERIWIQTSTPFEASTAECIVLSPNGTDADTLVLPAKFTLEAVRSEKAIGVLEESDGAHVVVAYKIADPFR